MCWHRQTGKKIRNPHTNNCLLLSDSYCTVAHTKFGAKIQIIALDYTHHVKLFFYALFIKYFSSLGPRIVFSFDARPKKFLLALRTHIIINPTQHQVHPRIHKMHSFQWTYPQCGTRVYSMIIVNVCICKHNFTMIHKVVLDKVNAATWKTLRTRDI